jgi:hypothetical protein
MSIELSTCLEYIKSGALQKAATQMGSEFGSDSAEHRP